MGTLSITDRYLSSHDGKASHIPGGFWFRPCLDFFFFFYSDKSFRQQSWNNGKYKHTLGLNAFLCSSITYWSNKSTAEPTNPSISQLSVYCALTYIFIHTSVFASQHKNFYKIRHLRRIFKKKSIWGICLGLELLQAESFMWMLNELFMLIHVS